MRSSFRYAAMLVVAVFVLGFAGNAYSQGVVLGGFKKISVEDAGVKAAAEFAAKAQGEKAEIEIEVLEIFEAERQSVAGTNYRLCLKVSSAGEDEEAAEYFVKAIVFFDLKKNYKLTSWTDSDCGGVEEEN